MKTKTKSAPKSMQPPMSSLMTFRGRDKVYEYTATFRHLDCDTWGERIGVASTEFNDRSVGMTFEAVQALYEYMLECRKDRDKAERETLEQWRKELGK